ncbi:hypothetical protein Lesp02_51100 [Lentzea sp. NBRC 105346]|nr:hypothetical protein Lesp02_51100 [Lentzea sp. NBRC 105346]
MVAALALALVAAAVLVLSDNARWLRLAVVAALWAALVGAFLAAKYRRQVQERTDEVADLQSVYELELEREVAARREYELEIESETRKRIEEESRGDIEALRADLRQLRDNLEALLGGDVLVERIALRAESTRLRSLSDQARITTGDSKRIITAGTAKQVVNAEKPSERTELIERVAHDAKVQAPRREPARPEPARPEPARTSPQARPQPTVIRREPQKPQEPQRREPQPTTRTVQPARATVDRVTISATPEPPTRANRFESASATPRVAPRTTQENVAARLNPAGPPPRQPASAQPLNAQSQRTEQVDRAEFARANKPQVSQPLPQVSQPLPQVSQSLPQVSQPLPRGGEPARRSRVAERTEMINREKLAADNRTQVTGGRRRADERDQNSGSWETIDPGTSSERTGGRRAAPEVTGRRAAAEPEPTGRRSAEATGGRRVATGITASEMTGGGGRRAAVEDPSGAHADGKSVSELLASLGGGEAPRRRRRRED